MGQPVLDDTGPLLTAVIALATELASDHAAPAPRPEFRIQLRRRILTRARTVGTA